MMNFETFKGRTPELKKVCKVHYHFTKKCFSIEQDGLVVGYAKNVMLLQATTKVSEKGRQRVLKNKVKNVHAHVKGILYYMPTEVNVIDMDTLYYNPYKVNNFVDSKGNHVEKADLIVMTGNQGYWK